MDPNQHQVMGVLPPQVVQMQWPQSQNAAPPMGPSSTHTICTMCGQDVYTVTSKKAKPSAWCCCMCMFLTGICSLGCCLIPCCMETFNIVNHKCPNCKAYLGQYKP